jgi:hypothetical protein
MKGARWAVYGLPAGLTVNPRTGVISGVPATSGRFPIEVTATSGKALGAAVFTLTVG